MTFFSRRALLLTSSGFLLGGAAIWLLVVATSGAALGVAEPARLWTWSLLPVQGVDGAATTLYEPFALVRNLALIAFASIGSMLGAYALLERLQGAPAPGRTDDPKTLVATRRKLDDEIANVTAMLRAHLDKNQNYGRALARGRVSLDSALSREQLRDAVKLLISENEAMTRATQDYERKLDESRAQVDMLRAALFETKELNARDGLTNAFSRRHFDNIIHREALEAARTKTSLSLVMADVDNFKKINDTFGHPIGDQVLRNVAELMIANTKGKDCVARYGGEEFAILLPSTNAQEAAGLAEQIRKKLEMQKWAVKGGAALGSITASFGVSQLAPNETATDLVRRADAKLYESKANGRNRVTR